MTEIQRAPLWRRTFERWLCRKFMVRWGPTMLARRGYWQFVDEYGNIWRLQPTHHPDSPFVIICESRDGR